MSLSPSPNHVGSTPYAASSSLTVKVSPSRPQPRSSLMPPPRVYMTVSRSGQTRRPWTQMSSPVLTMTVISAGAASCSTRCRSPRRNRLPPMPPARTVMRIRSSCQTRSAPGRPDPRRHDIAAWPGSHWSHGRRHRGPRGRQATTRTTGRERVDRTGHPSGDESAGPGRARRPASSPSMAVGGARRSCRRPRRSRRRRPVVLQRADRRQCRDPAAGRGIRDDRHRDRRHERLLCRRARRLG